ncbi:hypothetical protein SLS57_001251 [Botryosphaeria dothidea]
MFNQWAKHGVDVHAYVYNILFHAKEWETGAQEKDYIAFFFFHNVTLSESLSSDQADQKEETFEPLSYLMASMWINFFNTLSPNNIPINGTNVWPEYQLSDPKSLVFDVNATQLCRTEKDEFRSNAIGYWMNLFTTDEYPE